VNRIEFPPIGERYYAGKLKNGLPVRVVPKPEFARTYAFFAADYGSIDTKFTRGGRTVTTPDGVAHYLEHKLFDMPDGNAMQQFSRMGGSPNAFTGYSMTAYYVECTERPYENLELLLRLVSTPYFTDESVEKERGIIGQEIRMYEDSADSRLYENLFAVLYGRHPVRVPIAGSLESIAKITPELLYECHRAFYTPANMILCVAGPVEPEKVFDLAGRTLPEATGTVPARDYGAPEPMTGHSPRIETAMEVSMPGFSIGFKSEPPEEGAETLRRELLGDLAAEILVGESSPLYTRLYEEGLIDCDFSAGYEGLRGVSLLSMGGDSRDPDAVMEAVLREAGRIGREGVDPALFERLKKSAFGRRVRELDSFDNICYRMCQSCFEGAEYYDFPALYRTIGMDETAEYLRRTVRPERAAISVVRPAGKEA